MWIVTHKLKSPGDFMDRYLPDGPAGGLFLPQKFGMKEGQQVCIELHLVWLDAMYFLRGEVERSNMAFDNCGEKRVGAVVRLALEEASTRDEIVAEVKRSTSCTRVRGVDRVQCDLGAHYFSASSEPLPGKVVDLSPNGVRLVARKPLPVGTPIHVRLEHRGHRAMAHVRGHVTRLDLSGDQAAMGVAFDLETRDERQRVSRLCEHLQAAFSREEVQQTVVRAATTEVRGCERAPVAMGVRYAAADEVVAHELGGQAVDLSITGMFVQTDRLLPVGSEINVLLEATKAGRFSRVKGRVARWACREDAAPGMGIEFTPVSRRERKLIRQALTRLTASPLMGAAAPA